jgi:putative transposase
MSDDRKQIILWIDEAVLAGARQSKACKILQLSAKTFQRWRNREDQVDGRLLTKNIPLATPKNRRHASRQGYLPCL